MPNIDRQKLRADVRDFLLDYQNYFADKVDHFLPRDQRRTVKIKGDLASRLQTEYEKFQPDTGYSTSLFGAVDIGLPKDAVEPYQANVLVRRAQSAELSFVLATIPVCGDGGHTHFDTFLHVVLRWCAICRPVHCTAGFALIFASGMSQNTKYALHQMKRFPGFDFVEGIAFSREVGDVHNRIKGIGWLTILSDQLVVELGGIEPMCDALEPVCKVQYPGGVVIQAGEASQLGDTYRNDIPEAYRMVARHTKLVRFEAYQSRLFIQYRSTLEKARAQNLCNQFSTWGNVAMCGGFTPRGVNPEKAGTFFSAAFQHDPNTIALEFEEFFSIDFAGFELIKSFLLWDHHAGNPVVDVLVE